MFKIFFEGKKSLKYKRYVFLYKYYSLRLAIDDSFENV